MAARAALAYLSAHREAVAMVAVWPEVRDMHGPRAGGSFHDEWDLYEEWSEASGVPLALVAHHAPALSRLDLMPAVGPLEDDLAAFLLASSMRGSGIPRRRRR